MTMKTSPHLPEFDSNRRIFVEITSLKPHGGPGWELGTCLWSPEKNTSGIDRYSLMRDPVANDLVLHFVGGTTSSSNKSLYGYSTVSKPYEVVTSRPPIPGVWAWSDTFYRIELEDHTRLDTPVAITNLIDEYLDDIKAEFVESADGSLNSPFGYPITKFKNGLRVASGLYIRECTPTLYRILSEAVGSPLSVRGPAEINESTVLIESQDPLFIQSTKKSTANRTGSTPRPSGKRATVIGRKGENLFLDYLKSPEGQMRFDVQGDLRDCSRENKGWDIEFIDSTGNLIAVEVKSKVAKKTPSITMTSNEWAKAEELGDHYRLVVIASIDGKPEFEEIRNPAAVPCLSREVSSWEIRLPKP